MPAASIQPTGRSGKLLGWTPRQVAYKMKKHGISVPDRQLACVPTQSAEGQAYLGAMRAAANFAWANRQAIAHWTREAFVQVLGRSAGNALEVQEAIDFLIGSARDPRLLARVLDNVRQSIEALPFGFLQKVDSQNLLTFIIDEHPQMRPRHTDWRRWF